MKDRRELMDRTREDLDSWQGSRCAMPGCTDSWTDPAHIEGSGSGGRRSTYSIENMVGLCRYHHDVFDGRDLAGRQRMLRDLMREYVKHQRAETARRRKRVDDT